MNRENHPEITTVKSFEELTCNPASFEVLLNKLILFEKESDYFPMSGQVTAALLDYDFDGKSILATWNGTKIYTFKCDRYELKKLISKWDVVVGNTPEESYFVKVN